LPGPPSGPVNDYAGALSAVQVSQLDAQLRGYERGTTRQIAVAIFKSLDDESLEDFSMRLAEKWKVGGKKNNDGVLMTLFLDEHKLRIEVGYGLEDKLTDAMSARIIRDVMAPKLRAGDVYRAVSAGCAAIDTVITGEKHEEGAPPAAAGAGDKGTSGEGLPFGVILFIGFFVVVFVLGLMGRGGFLFAILNLLFGGRGGGGGGGWSGGGGGWSGGGGGGGWSGGGGSFGGGGSSGSW
jgi:uncharacterized protein